jgi:hypothetical protein
MTPGHVRVEVADSGGGFVPEDETPEGSHAGGWGLYLVAQIADDWGVSLAEQGTCVWFELRFAA